MKMTTVEVAKTAAKARWGNQLERFLGFIENRGPEECWPWTGCKNDLGYGLVYFDGVRQRAHRVAFELANGRKAEKFVCHKCDNPSCCNPNHLFEGSQKDNIMDCAAKGRLNTCRGDRHPKRRAKLHNIVPIF